MAALKWNGWQRSSGMGGNFEPEYAIRYHQTENGGVGVELGGSVELVRDRHFYFNLKRF